MKKTHKVYISTILLIFPFFIYSFFPEDSQSHPPKRRKLNISSLSSFPSLRFLTTQKALDFKHDPVKREKLKKALEDLDFRFQFIEAFEFDGQVIPKIDLSGFNLLGINFSGCIFNGTNLSKANLRDIRLRRAKLKNVNLTNADLRITFSNSNYFSGAVFDNVDLEGALLYGDNEEESLYLKGRSDPYNLVKQYSDLIKQVRLEKEKGSVEKADLFYRQAQAINKLFSAIPVDLQGKNLNDLDFTDLDLSNANLKNASVKRLRISEDLIVPDYRVNLELFNKWINGTLEEQTVCQRLLNLGFNFFHGVPNDQLRAVKWSTKNLKNANFSSTDLHECDFTNVNLEGINLIETYLSRLKLSENVTLPEYPEHSLEYPWHIECFNKWVNGTVDEKYLYQKLLNTGFNFFHGVPNDLLRIVDWSAKDLTNANFNKAELQHCDFRKANLIGVWLEESNLQEVDLSYASLQNTNLEDANLKKANLEGASLRRVCLANANLEEAIFSEAELSEVKLQGAKFQGIKLERADLQGLNLSYTDLKEIDLNNANLEGANLKEANLNDANLEGANLKEANLNDAKLKRTNFKKANLKYANLEGAYLKEVELNEANLKRVNLQESCLKYTNLERANLKEANLNHANLEESSLRNTNLNGSILEGINFTGANLEGTNLRGAWITESIQVPGYLEENKAPLRDRWINGTSEERRFYQTLVDGGFKIE